MVEQNIDIAEDQPKSFWPNMPPDFYNKFTLEEYHQELLNPDSLPPINKDDPNDACYRRRYASSMPPLEAYYYRPADWAHQANEKEPFGREVYYGWNNLNFFELD